MNEEAIFKRYDIRGKYPEELNEEFAERIGRALGTFAKRNYSAKVVVGRDNKDTSESLKNALIEGITSTGCDVCFAGVGPTDYTAFAGMKKGVVSVEVTSSHMPLNFNGFKFMYPEGNGFLNPDLYKVQDIFREEDFETGSGTTKDISRETRETYFKEIKEYAESFEGSFDKKIVVDTLGGATTEYLPKLLEDLGAEVVNIAEEKDKHPYRDPPNPKPELLDELKKRVEEEDADLGLSNDMDADRVAVYYNDKWLSGDDLFFIFAQLIDGELVASIDSSKVLEEFADKVYYTRVGDPFVIDKTLKENVPLSGEPNGHYCFPDFVPYNSGTLAALIMAAVEIDPLLDNIPKIYVDNANLEVEDKEAKMKQVEEVVKSSYNVLSDKDGVKFNVDECSVLVRPSGSSPIIRVKSESESKSATSDAIEEVEELIRNA